MKEEVETKLHTDALQIILEGIRAADPYDAVKGVLTFKDNILKVKGEKFEVKGKLYLVGFGKAAFKMVEEIRRQFREIPGLMEGKKSPDYATCVDLSLIHI